MNPDWQKIFLTRSRFIFLWLGLFLFMLILQLFGWNAAFDHRVYDFAFAQSAQRRWIEFWEIATFVGETPIVYPLLLLSFVFFFLRFRSAQAAWFVMESVLIFLVPLLIKFSVQRPRPLNFSTIESLTTYSFPSGHAINSIVLFYFLPLFILFIFKKSPCDWSVLSRALGWVGIFMIGLSRVFLGMHWLSDVMAGWCLGAFISCYLLMRLKFFL